MISARILAMIKAANRLPANFKVVIERRKGIIDETEVLTIINKYKARIIKRANGLKASKTALGVSATLLQNQYNAQLEQNDADFNIDSILSNI